jgi:flagellar biosynthesis GTPase FlhF
MTARPRPQSQAEIFHQFVEDCKYDIEVGNIVEERLRDRQLFEPATTYDQQRFNLIFSLFHKFDTHLIKDIAENHRVAEIERTRGFLAARRNPIPPLPSPARIHEIYSRRATLNIYHLRRSLDASDFRILCELTVSIGAMTQDEVDKLRTDIKENVNARAAAEEKHKANRAAASAAALQRQLDAEKRAAEQAAQRAEQQAEAARAAAEEKHKANRAAANAAALQRQLDAEKRAAEQAAQRAEQRAMEEERLTEQQRVVEQNRAERLARGKLYASLDQQAEAARKAREEANRSQPSGIMKYLGFGGKTIKKRSKTIHKKRHATRSKGRK